MKQYTTNVINRLFFKCSSIQLKYIIIIAIIFLCNIEILISQTNNEDSKKEEQTEKSKESEEIKKINYNYKSVQGVSIGGGGFVEMSMAGGFAEVAFNLFSKESFDIRNHIKIGGSGTYTDVFLLTLSERLSFGSIKPINNYLALRRYFIIEASFSFFRRENKRNFFKGPYLIDIKIGSGLDIMIGKSAYYIEMMLGYMLTTEGDNAKQLIGIHPFHGAISIGGRKYF